MKKEEILNYSNKKVSEEVLEKIEESECVEMLENCGYSGTHVDCIWYTITFTDKDEISVYHKTED